MAASALQVPGFGNVFTNRTLLALPLPSSVVPRTNPKCSMLLVPHLVPSRTAKLHKLCIVRATSPKEAATSNTPLTDVQKAPQKGRKKGIIRKLTSQPELYDDQVPLEKQLRFAICAGIIAQWTIGAVRGFPTESATQNLKEQVYVPSLC